MPATPEQLRQRLEALGVETQTHHHAPVYTVEESKAMRGNLSGGHCKSLFLKDKKGKLWLVVTPEDRTIDLKALRHAIGAHGLSFAKPELLMEVLGVEPGSVTPFGVINDTDLRVRVVLDSQMMSQDMLNYHPLVNSQTTQITPDGLMVFLRACGYEPDLVEI